MPFTHWSALLPRHRLCHVIHGAHLICLLTEGARPAATAVEQVTEETSTDTLLLSHLAAHLRHADPVEDGDEHREPAETTVLADLLSDLAGDDTWTAPDTDERLAVVTTSAQIVLPVTGHVCWLAE
jgi:hypothetical protein